MRLTTVARGRVDSISVTLARAALALVQKSAENVHSIISARVGYRHVWYIYEPVLYEGRVCA